MADPEAVIACNHFAIFRVLLLQRAGRCVTRRRELAGATGRIIPAPAGRLPASFLYQNRGWNPNSLDVIFWSILREIALEREKEHILGYKAVLFVMSPTYRKDTQPPSSGLKNISEARNQQERATSQWRLSAQHSCEENDQTIGAEYREVCCSGERNNSRLTAWRGGWELIHGTPFCGLSIVNKYHFVLHVNAHIYLPFFQLLISCEIF